MKLRSSAALSVTAFLAAGCPAAPVSKPGLPPRFLPDAGATGATDAGAGADAGPFATAAHSTTLIPDNGGPTLGNATAVYITFANDPNRAYIEGLGRFLSTSHWLEIVGPQYGITSLGSLAIGLQQSAPSTLTDADLQSLLQQLLQDGTVPGGAVDAGSVTPDAGAATADGGASTLDAGARAHDGGAADAGPGDAGATPQYVYLFFLPASTAFTNGGQALCSFSGGGYHNETQLSNLDVPYAVVQPCPAQGLTDLDVLQLAASHELIEALTDPYPVSQPAYAIKDPMYPLAAFGGEVGDACSFLAPRSWSEGSYDQLQRVWSNSSAADGGDPCLPAPSPYFGTSLTPETAVAVAAGQSATFQLVGWSTAPVAPWTLEAQNIPIMGGQSFDSLPRLTPTLLNNGGQATLTLTVPQGTPSGSYSIVLVYSVHSQQDFTGSFALIYVP